MLYDGQMDIRHTVFQVFAAVSDYLSRDSVLKSSAVNMTDRHN